MTAPFLRRPTATSSGFSVGGGDTGMDVQPQPAIFTVLVTDTSGPKEFVLPKGMALLESWIIPHEAAQPTAGTVALIDVTNSVAYLPATAATAIAKNVLATPGQITGDTRYRVIPSGLSSGSAVAVGFLAIPPHIVA
jgi:hypothetical protein